MEKQFEKLGGEEQRRDGAEGTDQKVREGERGGQGGAGRVSHSLDPVPSLPLSVRSRRRREGAIRSGEKSTRMRIGEERGRAEGRDRSEAEDGGGEGEGMVNPECDRPLTSSGAECTVGWKRLFLVGKISHYKFNQLCRDTILVACRHVNGVSTTFYWLNLLAHLLARTK